jgi:hypothetical protein
MSEKVEVMKTTILVLGYVLLLVACGAAGTAPETGTATPAGDQRPLLPELTATGEEDVPEPAGGAAVPASGTAETTPVNARDVTPSPVTEATVTGPPEPAADETSTVPVTAEMTTPEVVTPEIVTPVTVDLSQLTPEPTRSGPPREAPDPVNPDPEAAMIQATTRDLAFRLQLDVSEVSVMDVQAVDWPDSSLGCPAPGTGYLDVITPGFQIILEAQGTTYTYHTDTRSTYVLCVDGQPG